MDVAVKTNQYSTAIGWIISPRSHFLSADQDLEAILSKKIISLASYTQIEGVACDIDTKVVIVRPSYRPSVHEGVTL